jgi:hypothetical protein
MSKSFNAFDAMTNTSKKNSRDRAYVGIDNGVTGSIGIVDGPDYYRVLPMPVKNEQSYTKLKQNISRVNYPKLLEILQQYTARSIVVIERPMVNPTRFKSSGSALRCLEAVLIAVEQCGMRYMYCDSKDWQKDMLPKVKDKDRKILKTLSLNIGRRLFPAADWSKVHDGDALLIAEWARRKQL